MVGLQQNTTSRSPERRLRVGKNSYWVIRMNLLIHEVGHDVRIWIISFHLCSQQSQGEGGRGEDKVRIPGRAYRGRVRATGARRPSSQAVPRSCSGMNTSVRCAISISQGIAALDHPSIPTGSDDQWEMWEARDSKPGTVGLVADRGTQRCEGR